MALAGKPMFALAQDDDNIEHRAANKCFYKLYACRACSFLLCFPACCAYSCAERFCSLQYRTCSTCDVTSSAVQMLPSNTIIRFRVHMLLCICACQRAASLVMCVCLLVTCLCIDVLRQVSSCICLHMPVWCTGKDTATSVL